MATALLTFILSLVLGLVSWVVYLLPTPLRRALARGLALLMKLLHVRRQVIESNLEIVYPRDALEERNQKRDAFYFHFGNLILETLFIFGPGVMRQFITKKSSLHGQEHVHEALAQGRGAFFLSSHIGNWEIMAATGALLDHMNLLLVTKKLKPEALHTIVERRRKSYGVLGTYEPKTLKDIFRHLKANGLVGFVLDQYAGPPVGVRVPFLGVTVGTSNALATLVKRTQTPVFPVVSYRTEEGHWRVEISPAIAWISDENPHRELALNTAQYVSVIENQLRKYPTQWLWSHRRFKGDLSPLAENEWIQPRVRQ